MYNFLQINECYYSNRQGDVTTRKN